MLINWSNTKIDPIPNSPNNVSIKSYELCGRQFGEWEGSEKVQTKVTNSYLTL